MALSKIERKSSKSTTTTTGTRSRGGWDPKTLTVAPSLSSRVFLPMPWLGPLLDHIKSFAVRGREHQHIVALIPTNNWCWEKCGYRD